MYCCLLDPRRPPDRSALETVARACSPRIERRGDGAVLFDIRGLDRILGPAPQVAAEIERLAVAYGVTPRLVIAGTMTTAWLLAHARPGTTVVPAGAEEVALAELRIPVLATLEDGPGFRASCARATTRVAPTSTGVGAGLVPAREPLDVLLLWGLRTLGDLARLPEADVRTRLGEPGARLHQAARGRDAAPLVPAVQAPRFLERIELEWPIEGLEPLSFVLSRLCDALAGALDRADRGAVTVSTRLRLVTRATHERALNLPAPMRDPRVLRTLILLDLESHPPDAAIDVVELELDVTPGRIVQGALLSRSLPSPEHLSTLIARLSALMGESRVGSPALVDTHDERAVEMGVFKTLEQGRRHKALLPSAFCLLPSVRRFRLPVAVSVDVVRGAPGHVRPAARGFASGRVINCAGPWRSSGGWWRDGWDRDEWDVELTDGVYRLVRDRPTGRWEIEGVLD